MNREEYKSRRTKEFTEEYKMKLLTHLLLDNDRMIDKDITWFAVDGDHKLYGYKGKPQPTPTSNCWCGCGLFYGIFLYSIKPEHSLISIEELFDEP
jgi:hypothetical protein